MVSAGAQASRLKDHRVGRRIKFPVAEGYPRIERPITCTDVIEVADPLARSGASHPLLVGRAFRQNGRKGIAVKVQVKPCAEVLPSTNNPCRVPVKL